MKPDYAGDAWMVLLAQATQLAAAAQAWPDGAEGDRLRESVPDLVQLQAVRIAMEQLDRIPADRRAYARDHAEWLVRRASERLGERWRGEPMPEPMLEAMTAARGSIARSLYAGLRCLRWPGPGPLLVPRWLGELDGMVGTLAVMEPGTIALEGEVVAWWTEHPPLQCPGCREEPLPEPVQVYRRFDASGRYRDSATVPLRDELPAGMPMLLPLCVAGQRVGSLQRDPVAWLAMQRAAGVPDP
jgi:hypothetical protein